MPDATLTAPLPPGSTIGILGSGQLGRMLAMAAARLGLKSHIYDEEPGPAFDVAAHRTQAAFDDWTALGTFAAEVDAVTYEFENVPRAAVAHLARLVPVRPSIKALEVSQDRLAEKEFVSGLSIPVAEFRAVDSLHDLQSAVAAFNAPAILKTRRFGYDGKGQVSVRPGDDLGAAWRTVGERLCVLERRIPFACEISTLIVRGQSGDVAVYESPRNTHETGILRRSIVPAHVPEEDIARARQIAQSIAQALGYVGVLTVEMFHLGENAPPDQRLVVNELAPRVHNSGHWTIEACPVSQFENHMRAVAGWPLGTTERHSDAEMLNLIGAEALEWQKLATDPSACVHLYGKRDARPGRKMGHVTRLSAKGTGPVT